LYLAADPGTGKLSKFRVIQLSSSVNTDKELNINNSFKVELEQPLDNNRKYLSTNPDGSIVDLWNAFAERQTWNIQPVSLEIDQIVYRSEKAKSTAQTLKIEPQD